MPLIVEAVYENGVLKPARPLPLKEHEQVQITVHSRVSNLADLYGMMGFKGTIEEAQRIVAVGTTVVRALESCDKLEEREGSTDIFIRPPHAFRFVDVLLTNFHLPRSTLLMLVSAFASRELILKAYEEAVRERYRFFSYGDCMLIL